MGKLSLRRLRPLTPVAALCLALLAPAAALHAQTASKSIYPDPSAAHEDLQTALTRASHEHKRVLLDFGGNWCGDCRVLDIYFDQAPNADLLARNFVKVDVNVGKYDANQDIAKKYGVPLERGVPALVVLDSNGKLLFTQKNGEFESMRKLQSSDLTAFLERWKPATR